ncbi:MAG: ABC transporter ATP-binding protein/permease [Leptospiraceae bacterium]|nr:ABC transporter ATP-binding protein/permease [Leptospiraceae bacterium]
MIPKDYLQLWKLIPKKRKIQYIFILILVILSAFAEIFSLGAIVPFLGVLISPEKVFLIEEFRIIWDFFQIYSAKDIIFPVTLMFITAAILAGITRISLLYFGTRLSYATGSDISIEIYRKTLLQPYSVHVARNSSEVITGVSIKANAIVGSVLQPILVITSSSIIILTIILGVIIVDPQITFYSFGIFGILYYAIAQIVKRRLFENGKIVAKSHSTLQKALQEGLGSIRDVLLDGNQEFYVNIYKKSDTLYRKAIGNNLFLSASPRYVIETIGIGLLALFAYNLSLKSESLLLVIPLLGALAMGAQRILPVLQQLYASWASLKNGKGMLEDVLSLLNAKLDMDSNPVQIQKTEELKFEKLLQLKNVNFKYGSNLPYVLNNFSIDILQGSRVGIIGKTGSGKSTLIDIIMGLLLPSSGQMMVDGKIINQSNLRKWQSLIAHVPQTIYLADSTISENIAFGVPNQEVDFERVKTAAKKAQISSYIESLKEGYNSFVGERGIRLSGGQKQRIGIARALYKNASIIVFDEATSALDNETERAVMDSIDNLGTDLTIIMIAHRTSTLQKCNQIIDFNQTSTLNKNI